MNSRRAATLGALGLALASPALLGSCAGRLADDESAYRVDRAELGCATDLFQQRCSSEYCHDSQSPTGHLDLRSLGYRSRLVGVPASDPGCEDRLLVDPGAPASSFLLEKLSKDQPQCGERMPLSGEPISEGELECVEAWIGHLLDADGGIFGGTDADGGGG